MNSASLGVPPTIAVVGSGPSGCYSAQFLRKAWPTSEIAVFDALPTPYGLIRYGVAPDHQGTKAVTRQFDRLFERGGVRFVGNIRIGTDLALDDLVQAFDVVVLATGITGDRPLGVPQDARARTVGAGVLLRGINGYPGLAECDQLSRPLGRRVTIVGNGNVAMDALRLIVKDSTLMAGSDVDDDIFGRLRSVPVEHVDVVGRSSASNAKFDLAALREVAQLTNVDIEVGETGDDDTNPVLDVLLDNRCTARNAVKVVFHFGQSPSAVSFDDGTTVLETRGTENSGRVWRYTSDSVVTAVGFVNGDDSPAATWSAPNVWHVGWLRRGPRGTIPENRRDASEVSDTIVAAVREGVVPTGKAGLSDIWPKIAGLAVGFDDWRRLDEYERQAGGEQRCRRKVTSLDEMVHIALGTPTAACN